MDLKKLNETIRQYYPETIFSEDLDQKMERIEQLLASYKPDEIEDKKDLTK